MNVGALYNIEAHMRFNGGINRAINARTRGLAILGITPVEARLITSVARRMILLLIFNGV